MNSKSGEINAQRRVESIIDSAEERFLDEKSTPLHRAACHGGTYCLFNILETVSRD